jgi:hypothetical protein
MTGAGTPRPKPKASFGAVKLGIENGFLGDSETRFLAVERKKIEGQLRRAKSGRRRK